MRRIRQTLQHTQSTRGELDAFLRPCWSSSRFASGSSLHGNVSGCCASYPGRRKESARRTLSHTSTWQASKTRKNAGASTGT